MKCFDYHKKTKKACERINCRYWVNCKESQMCCINLCKEESKLTLEDVGKLFEVTRMRICQIEKAAVAKLAFIKEKIQ